MGILPSYSAKEIMELIKKGFELEAQEKIMELRQAALELQEENLALKEEVKGLKEDLEIKGQIERDEEMCFFYLVDEDDRKGPFCQRCYDKERRLIHLRKMYVDSDYRECLDCGKQYHKPMKIPEYTSRRTF